MLNVPPLLVTLLYVGVPDILSVVEPPILMLPKSRLFVVKLVVPAKPKLI